MKVVDANVVVKWFVPEPGEAIAQELLLTQEILIAPSIIRLEVLAAIMRCVRDKRSTVTEAELRCRKWLSQLDDRAIVTVDDCELLSDAISLGMKVKHQLFDCLYLALCKRLDATLVTFDEELSKRAKLASIVCQLIKEPPLN